MDTAISEFLINHPTLNLIVTTLLALSWFAGNLVSKTSTPPPNTPWGKIYAVLEVFGTVYGKAKEVGVPVPEQPSVEELIKDMTALKTTLNNHGIVFPPSA